VAASAATTSRPPLTRRLLGRQPIGYLFVALVACSSRSSPICSASRLRVFYDYFRRPGDRGAPFVGLITISPLWLTGVPPGHAERGLFIAINVPLTVFVGLILATALNTAIPFRTFFRASYFVPYVTASVAVIGVWLWLFNSDGLVNNLLGPLAPDPSWLVNSFWAMPIIALVATWKQLGFYVLLYLAALQNIPEELYEAAEVDGAGTVKRFTAITLPGVRPTTTLVVIAATITGANFFTEPYLLTGRGGPAGASVSPVLMMYTEGIEQGHAGYAAAIGVLLAIGVIAVSLVNRYLLERS
jgi:multiple sugar transport system permease protein